MVMASYIFGVNEKLRKAVLSTCKAHIITNVYIKVLVISHHS